jgi:3-deoxy-D-manno-octulosonic-acid transferase
MTALLRAYALASRVAGPILARSERRKLAHDGFAAARQAEKIGRASLPRPDGPVVWLHGASVGESLSLLPLISEIRQSSPKVCCLVTSGTASSAALLEERLPGGVIHQFMALDCPAYAGRFLDHWRPQLAIFAESEIWPVHLRLLAERGVPIALVNARMSMKSRGAWARRPASAAQIFGGFALLTAQSDDMARTLIELGAAPDKIRTGPELKALAPPPPVDRDMLAQMRGWAGSHPLWLAASTHPGEDDTVLDAHSRLRDTLPGARLVIVPRHPERGADVLGLATEREFVATRRSERARHIPTPETEIYIADTLGELGLWYSLADVAFIGGSLAPLGGHNPFEAAQLDCAILHGPQTANFRAAYARLDGSGAAICLRNATDLADAVHRLLTSPEMLTSLRANASAKLDADEQALDTLAADLLSLVAGRP